MTQSKKPSLSLIATLALSILITCLSIFHYRSDNNIKHIITWDVFGYYLYLPATFIHDDIAMHDKNWVDDAKRNNHASATLYQIIKGAEDKWVIIYTMGLAIIYAPFFFISHLFAGFLGYPTDGFSVPYQWGILCCGLVYTIIGLFVLRKVLLAFFSEFVACIVLSLVVLGTNYFQLTVFEGTITHNFMYTLNAIILLLTIRWHETHRLKHALWLAFCIGFATMSRPIELLWIFVPILWNICDYQSLVDKAKLLLEYKWQLLAFALVLCLAGVPQMIYWKVTTGHFIYYTYEMGFNFSKPHLLQILFSYKKGWFLYTPLMMLAVAGFVFLFKYNKKIFFPLFLTFIAVLYVFASYEAWWFATSFSSRAMMDAYPILSIVLGYMIHFISMQKKSIKWIFALLVVILVTLNLFQIWQYNNGIIDQERMTKDYYWKVFGKTFTTEEYKELLEVERSLESVEYLKKEFKFNKKQLALHDFEIPLSKMDSIHFDSTLFHSGARSLRLDSSLIFSPGAEMKYSALTKKEYAWIRTSIYVYPKYDVTENPASLVITFENKHKSYKYRALDMDTLNLKVNQWNKVSMDYMTPIIKSTGDILKVYVWHRGRKALYIDDLLIEVFEPKDKIAPK